MVFLKPNTMKTEHLIKTDSNHFSILVCHCVDQYDPPEHKSITIKRDWDGYQIEQILELEHFPKIPHKEPMSPAIDSIKKKVFDAYLAKVRYYEDTHFADFDEEPDSNYFSITFWQSDDKSYNDLVLEYLYTFHVHLLNEIWGKRGADDDYYDYCPSITDVFYQLCKIFEAMDIWNTFIKDLILQEPEVLEDSLYRH